jgi:hypothetical protein
VTRGAGARELFGFLRRLLALPLEFVGELERELS